MEGWTLISITGRRRPFAKKYHLVTYWPYGPPGNEWDSVTKTESQYRTKIGLRLHLYSMRTAWTDSMNGCPGAIPYWKTVKVYWWDGNAHSHTLYEVATTPLRRLSD